MCRAQFIRLCFRWRHYINWILIDPRGWLQNKLRDSSISVILLLNMAAPYACDSNVVYRMSHCFDYLFPYAIQLLQTYEHRSYHSFYKIVTPETNLETFVFLNTLTTYNVPQHTSDLLSNLKITGEKCRIFKELFKNECNVYHDSIASSTQCLQSIFVQIFFWNACITDRLFSRELWLWWIQRSFRSLTTLLFLLFRNDLICSVTCKPST